MRPGSPGVDDNASHSIKLTTSEEFRARSSMLSSSNLFDKSPHSSNKHAMVQALANDLNDGSGKDESVAPSNRVTVDMSNSIAKRLKIFTFFGFVLKIFTFFGFVFLCLVCQVKRRILENSMYLFHLVNVLYTSLKFHSKSGASPFQGAADDSRLTQPWGNLLSLNANVCQYCVVNSIY